MQLEGTKDSPKVVWITKDFKNEAKVTLVKQDGSAVANEKITAISKSGLYRKEYTTDANGVIYINVDDFESSADLYFTDRTYEFVKGTQEDGTVMSDAYSTVSPLQEGFYWTFTVVENANYTEPLDYIDYEITLTEARPLLFNVSGLLNLDFKNDDDSFNVDNLFLYCYRIYNCKWYCT